MSEAPESFQNALAAQRAGRLEEAAAGYRATIAVHPEAAPAYHNLAAVLSALGRTDEVEAVLRAALARFPRAPAVRMNLALQRLAEGDYAEGLPLYEARTDIEDAQSGRPDLAIPEWRGEPLAGKHVLVWPEQGLGDKIMWSRFAPVLQARGAKVTMLCEPALVRLFAGAFDAEVIAASGEVTLPEADYWALYGSIPWRLGVTLQTLPNAPYLAAPPRPRPGARIGVASRGNPRLPNDRNRSLPEAEAARLRALPGAVSLHYEDLGVYDFQDTAQLVASLDLVISVDTAVAHLAGALGKPTWLLLPAHGTDWRWLRGRADSPWYPSARLFRQTRGEPWSAVVTRVLEALARPCPT